MSSLPKPPVWASPTASSKPITQISGNQSKAKLSLNAWPELPSKDSQISTSSTLVFGKTSTLASEKTLPAKYKTPPKRSGADITPPSLEGSPTPRQKLSYSKILNPSPKPSTPPTPSTPPRNIKVLHASKSHVLRPKIITPIIPLPLTPQRDIKALHAFESQASPSKLVTPIVLLPSTPQRDIKDLHASESQASPSKLVTPIVPIIPIVPIVSILSTSQGNDKALHTSKSQASQSNLAPPSIPRFSRSERRARALRASKTQTSSSKMAPLIVPVSSARQGRVGTTIPYSSRVGPVPFGDLAALQTSLTQEPQGTFVYYQTLVQENEELKEKLATMDGMLDFERQHLKKTIQTYEDLDRIAKEKQVILWKFVQRLIAGDNGSRASASEPVMGMGAHQEAHLKLQIEQSRDNAKLDPNAHTFFPFANTSPTKLPNQKSYTPTSGTMASQSSTTSDPQEFIATPATPTGPAGQTTLFNMPDPASPSMLEAITNSIPALFRTICPFSLTGTDCPIPTCQMKKLCPRHNGQFGLSNCPARHSCRQLHERPTCLGEAEGVGCGYKHDDNEVPSPAGKGKGKSKGKGKMGELDLARKTHFKCTVHHNQCGAEEWRFRLVIAGLRQAHKEGRYNQ